MLLYEKNIFSRIYIQYEIGLDHHFVIIVNNGGSGVHNTDKRAKEAKEKEQYSVSPAQTGSIATAAFVLLNTCYDNLSRM